MPTGTIAGNCSIGGYWAPTSNNTGLVYDLNGYISNFALWDSALTSEQAISLYNNGTPEDANMSALSPKIGGNYMMMF